MSFILNKLLPSLLILGAAYGGNILLKKFLVAILDKAKGGELDPTVKRLAIGASVILIYVVAVLMILDIFGINTSGLLAMLGACGLAIGLALKDTLTNFIL